MSFSVKIFVPLQQNVLRDIMQMQNAIKHSKLWVCLWVFIHSVTLKLQGFGDGVWLTNTIFFFFLDFIHPHIKKKSQLFIRPQDKEAPNLVEWVELGVAVVPSDWTYVDLRSFPISVLRCLKTEADPGTETSCFFLNLDGGQSPHS